MYGLKELISDNEYAKFLEREVGDYLRSVTNAPQLYSNDLRHQYAAAVFTQMRGEKITGFLGGLNEIFGFLSGHDDMNIDKYNNDVGIEYGLKYTMASRADILRLLFQDYAKNRAERLKKICI